MASHPPILQQCFQAAAAASKPALEHCVDHAVSVLQQAEHKSVKAAERNELALAWRELLAQRTDWGQRYPRDLLAAFQAAAAEPAPARPEAPVAARSGAGKFSLVDDSQVVEAIESSRLLQQVLPVVDQTLSELDTLISSALGLANVAPERNPVRPEIFAQVLRTLIGSAAQAEPAVGALWLRHMAEPLGRELKALYEGLVELLKRANVRAASYRVLQAPASVGSRGPAGAGTAPGTAPGAAGPGTGGAGAKPPSQYADLSAHDINDALFQDFLFHGGGHAQHGLAPSYYAAVDQELAALKATPDSAQDDWFDEPPPQYQALPAVDRPPRFVDVLSQLSSQIWGVYGRARERALVRTQLRKDATRVGQVLGLEVVRKVVNQVAQDPRLLVPVREAIVALEPSLLRLAMVDSRFLSDERHPARRLMEQVAQRSFKYNDEFSSEFAAFFQPVAESFNTLNQVEGIEDASPFATALSQLGALWTAQDRQEHEQHGDVVQAMRFAEERQAMADQIAWNLSSRTDLDNVPGVVLDFLFGPWSLVMAHARLTDRHNQIDPQGFGSVVPDLLWSVKKEVTLRRPVRLIEMIPGMLSTLHTGLDLLGQDPRENQPFFDAMMKLHRPVLKLRRAKSRRDAQESASMDLLSAPMELESAAMVLEDAEDLPMATAEQRTPKAAGQPWLGPQELDAAGFEDTLPSDLGVLAPIPNDSVAAALAPALPDAPPAASPGDDAPLDPGQILLSLREGSWVDLYSKRRWLRAQLIWASTKGTLFMFVSHGGQPHSMTKRSCERLIRDRLLRPVDAHEVVAHALDALAQPAAGPSSVPAELQAA
ncbi:DUF1631 family protein [Variovorax terrae]|uniref:DUF1631 domain-containing protein n=1 Tax=Variovorax terrae TaxID=2923278 RepID=A0A9X1VZA8_9BURK|nr:DUF1631 family protein [Variovorax terrae]MCJ0766018.1 DUF1631 domain-containing protein [Variovorax terrae]